MQTGNIVDENIEFLQKKFANCIVEGKDENGNITKMVDFDLLKQELSKVVVDGDKERYTMTWPDKKQAILTANSPIAKTLRPCKDKSVDFDNTKNIYIEGDNLDVLKVLRETYLGKIKLIYIDPPYNTGNDFVYNDDFATDTQEYLERSNQIDEDGNRMVTNNESNGRFHTDWLNMIYPRLKIAKDLLSDDGVILASIDDYENNNLVKIFKEIFGERNFIGQIPILSNPRGRQSSEFIAQTHEYLIVFAKSKEHCSFTGEDLTLEQKNEYKYSDDRGNYRLLGLRLRGGRCTAAESPTLHFPIYYNEEEDDFYLEKKSPDDYEIIPKFEDGTLGTWRWSKAKINNQKSDLVVKPVKDRFDVFQKDYLTEEKRMKLKSLWYEKEINYDNSAKELNSIGMGDVFDYSKPLYLIKKILRTIGKKNDLILDFFSGSATTAHATMQMNAEDGGNRQFIMVQLPEVCDEKGEAFRAGYKNICEIGEERIRRAGQKIVEEITKSTRVYGKDKKPLENNDFDKSAFQMALDKIDIKNWESTESEDFQKLADKKIPDIGFRVFKLDSSNMKDTYYKPSEYTMSLLDTLDENIKPDRTPEDLLFQVMLDLGLMLDSKIEEKNINGKKVFIVGDYNEMIKPDLMCCFDSNIDNATVTEIAKMQPRFAVFRDSSLSKDSVAVNFDQIFETYSPSTTRKVL